jgi:hypothetical protein
MELKPAQKIFIFTLLLGSACSQSTPPIATVVPANQTPNNLNISPIDPNGHCSMGFVSEWDDIAANSKLLLSDLAKNKLGSLIVQADLQAANQTCTAFYANESGISCLAVVKNEPKLVDSKTPAELCDKVVAAIQKYTLRLSDQGSDLFSHFDSSPAGQSACEENFLLVFTSFQTELTDFQNAREKVLVEEEENQVNDDDLANELTQAKMLASTCDELVAADQNSSACSLAATDGTMKSISVDKLGDFCQVAKSFQQNKPVTSRAIANARLRRARTAFPRLYPIEYLP